MLHLLPDTLDPHTTGTHLYDSFYEAPPAFVTQLMALTPCADDDPRSVARRALPVFRAPLTHPLSDGEQWEALLLDHERYEDHMTTTIRATSVVSLRPAPTPIYTHWRRECLPLPQASGDDQFFVGG